MGVSVSAPTRSILLHDSVLALGVAVLCFALGAFLFDRLRDTLAEEV